jgi:hypothetical protein
MCSFKPCPIHIATREFVTVGGGARGSRQGHEAARGNGGARRLAAGDRRRARRWALGFARARWAELGGVARGGSWALRWASWGTEQAELSYRFLACSRPTSTLRGRTRSATGSSPTETTTSLARGLCIHLLTPAVVALA